MIGWISEIRARTKHSLLCWPWPPPPDRAIPCYMIDLWPKITPKLGRVELSFCFYHYQEVKFYHLWAFGWHLYSIGSPLGEYQSIDWYKLIFSKGWNTAHLASSSRIASRSKIAPCSEAVHRVNRFQLENRVSLGNRSGFASRYENEKFNNWITAFMVFEWVVYFFIYS